MSLDLCSQLLKVLHNRAVNRPTQISVLVGDDACLVSDGVEDILHV